ncbi:MAG: hypothetical protein AAGG69_15440 [Pseudomonadota bacterium]
MSLSRQPATLIALALTLGSAHATEAMLTPSGNGEYGLAAKGISADVVISGDAESTFSFSLAISEVDETVLTHTVEDIFSIFALPAVRLVEMDATNDTLEVQLSSWTGGAHCCNDILVFTKGEQRWKQLDVGSFDAFTDPGNLIDADYDGVFDLVAVDDRFLYTFASYAGSAAPVRVLGIRGGAIADVTSEPQFENVVRSSLNDMGEMPDAGEARNSWLATYAAHLLLLGEDDPLDFALGSHDPSVNWGMTRCIVPEVNFSCPEGKEETVGFERALTEFLTETGYLR